MDPRRPPATLVYGALGDVRSCAAAQVGCGTGTGRKSVAARAHADPRPSGGLRAPPCFWALTGGVDAEPVSKTTHGSAGSEDSSAGHQKEIGWERFSRPLTRPARTVDYPVDRLTYVFERASSLDVARTEPSFVFWETRGISIAVRGNRAPVLQSWRCWRPKWHRHHQRCWASADRSRSITREWRMARTANLECRQGRARVASKWRGAQRQRGDARVSR